MAVPARDAAGLTRLCLGSLIFTLRSFPGSFEVLLIDDQSHDDSLCQIFQDFRSKTGWPVRVFRLQKRGHYTGVFNVAMSQAQGKRLFFLSNDMQVTPYFLNALLGVAGLHDDIAVVRGTSEYTDSFPQHRVVPPFPLRGYEDILAFSAYVNSYHGLAHVEDVSLSGDAVLIQSKVMQELGGFDPQFFGYCSDLDYGLRAQQRGYRLVCAQGAWLHHEGAGHIKAECALEQLSWDTIRARREQLIQADYELFRAKWDPQLQPLHEGVRYDFERLRARSVTSYCEFAPPPFEEV